MIYIYIYTYTVCIYIYKYLRIYTYKYILYIPEQSILCHANAGSEHTAAVQYKLQILTMVNTVDLLILGMRASLYMHATSWSEEAGVASRVKKCFSPATYLCVYIYIHGESKYIYI